MHACMGMVKYVVNNQDRHLNNDHGPLKASRHLIENQVPDRTSHQVMS